MQLGTVYWFTGLSGAGKTTIANAFFNIMKTINTNTVFLDGDELRYVYGAENNYSYNERKKIALQNSRLCKLIADQNINVICATISMFHECYNWNRENIKNYQEIFIDVPLEIQQRDQATSFPVRW